MKVARRKQPKRKLLVDKSGMAYVAEGGKTLDPGGKGLPGRANM